jgi:3-oxoacyl-ACP reductase-like protein
MGKAPINTNLGIDVSLTSPAAVTGISVSTPSEPKGKDEFAVLSDILKEINPAVKS